MKTVGCKSIILSFLLTLLAFPAAAALTAEQVAQKAAALISDPKGVSATFTLAGNGRSTNGTVKTSGSKFAVLMPQVSSWYNGKALYTYNPRINETTVLTPTATELMESNPLLYVKGGTGYRYSFSPVKRTGKYVIDVVPVKKGSGIKKLTITVNSSSFAPEKITVDTGSGTSVITVTSFKGGVSVPASEFEYPKTRYPKAEIVDLR